jgi:phage gp29-like protein
MMMKKEKPFMDEIATVENDIYQDYIGKVQVNPDKILRSESGGKGIELYEDLLRDDQVGSNLQTRKLAVVGKEWDVTPATGRREDQKIAAFVKEALLACNYDDARKTLLTGIVTGFKPAEVMWEYSEGQVWIKEIIGKAPRRFTFDLRRNLRLLTIGNMIEGTEVPPRKFVVYTNASDNGSPFGDGLGRLLYWPVWFKKHAVRFWMIFADKFGSPTAIGKYPPGTPQAQQDDLLSAIDAIQQESAIKIPNNVEIELLEATRSGSVNTYESLCTFMNAAISKVLLGQTLTTEMGGGGSYAASRTHNDIRADYTKADADSLSAALNNQLVRWIVDYNFPGVTRYPKVWIRTDQEKDLKPLADRDKVLIVDMGVPVGSQYIYDTYGIPRPEESEQLVKVPTKVTTGEGLFGGAEIKEDSWQTM